MATAHLIFSLLVLLTCQAAVESFPPWEKLSTPPTELPLARDSFLLPWPYSDSIEVDPLNSTQMVDVDALSTKPGFYLGDVYDLDPVNGVFTAKTGGVFLFTANVQLERAPSMNSRRRRSTEPQVQEVSIALCVEDNSSVHEVLVTHSVLSTPTTTLSVVGNLQLSAEQKVTVKITNNSKSPVTIPKGSSSFATHRL